MIRNVLCAFMMVGSALSVAACAAPVGTSESTGSSASADTVCVNGVCPTSQTVALSAFNPKTQVLTGTVAGETVEFQYSSSTENLAADINAWPPEPVRPLAVAWNAVLDLGQQPGLAGLATILRSAVLDDYARLGGSVSLTTGPATGSAAPILSLQPVPSSSH